MTGRRVRWDRVYHGFGVTLVIDSQGQPLGLAIRESAKLTYHPGDLLSAYRRIQQARAQREKP